LECFAKRTELLPLDTSEVTTKKQLQELVQSLQPTNGAGGGNLHTVGDIMHKSPITIAPQTTILEVIALMNQYNIKVLPVVKNQELVGVISEKDFMLICKRLIKRLHSDKKGSK
jgi:predicted transcriptional regulator